jgi:hypothetical protein
MIRKRSGQTDGQTDGRTDGQTDGHVRHTIIRPVIDGRIKIWKREHKLSRQFMCKKKLTEVARLTSDNV